MPSTRNVYIKRLARLHSGATYSKVIFLQTVLYRMGKRKKSKHKCETWARTPYITVYLEGKPYQSQVLFMSALYRSSIVNICRCWFLWKEENQKILRAANSTYIWHRAELVWGERSYCFTNPAPPCSCIMPWTLPCNVACSHSRIKKGGGGELEWSCLVVAIYLIT